MKKIFRYVENTWVGDDKKPSIKRILAIAFSIHIIYSVTSSLRSYIRLVDLVYFNNKSINAEMIAAAGAGLANIAMILGVEAGLVAALLGLASYQTINFKKKEELG